MATTQTFTATGSWVAPVGVRYVDAQCWGGGGSGGTSATNGTGGAGGAYAHKLRIPVFPGTSYTVTVGTGGAAQSTGAGNPGNDSWFSTNTTVLAKGGSAGIGAAGTSAQGGQAASCIGDVAFNGGNSGTATGNWSSGGGGSAGSGGAGGNSANASSGVTNGGIAGVAGAIGGAGAAGSNAVDFASTSAGTQPGSGSGGSSTGPNSIGKGGDGQVILTWSYINSPNIGLRPHPFSPGLAR